MKINTKMLLAYSASAVGYLHIAGEVKAQAIYTDIDPDSVWLPLETWFYTSEDILYVDMDNDGHNDFRFLNLSYEKHYYYSTHDQFRQRIWAGRAEWSDDNLNFLAASYQNIWSDSGYYFRNYPYAIEIAEIINSDLNFRDAQAQRMAFRTYSHFYGEEDTIFWTDPDGNWYPESGDTTENKYLGVKFLSGIDEKTHYGWIRCSVIDNHEEGFTLIVKDYAYESKAETPIAAGDTIGDTSVVIIESILENLPNGIHVYSFQKKIYILVSEKEYLNAEANIYSITGEKLYVEKLEKEKTEIDFSRYASGVYLVEVTSGEGKAIKKVWME